MAISRHLSEGPSIEKELQVQTAHTLQSEDVVLVLVSGAFCDEPKARFTSSSSFIAALSMERPVLQAVPANLPLNDPEGK